MDSFSEDSGVLFLLKDIGLTEEQKKILSDRLELIMQKYNTFASNCREVSKPYFEGVYDGLNNAHKMINNVVDDYLFLN